MKLTKDQKKAVSLKGLHVLLSAGAGTGKTRTLVERVVELVARRGVPVSELLILTFTEKAAGEIKQRISKRFQEENLFSARQDLEAAYISTFHGFSARLLRNHPVEAGVDPEFRVLENEEAELLQEEALDETVAFLHETQAAAFELFKSYGEWGLRAAILNIHHVAGQEGLALADYFLKWKKVRSEKISNRRFLLKKEAFEIAESASDKLDLNAWMKWVELDQLDWKQIELFREWFESLGRSPKLTPFKNFVKKDWLPLHFEKFADEVVDLFEQAALKFESVYTQKKQSQNGLDFDDLQVISIQMLRQNHPGAKIVANALRRQFRFVFVDEFQDTSHLQMELVRFLMPQAETFLVGDYKQSIYAFRGAEPRLFLETESEFEGSEAAVKIDLADNFRSEAGVLDFANSFFEKLWQEDGTRFAKLTASKPKTNLPLRKPELLIVESDTEGGAAEDRLREGSRIAARMRELNRKGVPYGDMAVLFSAMTNSALYEYALRNAGIPYVSVSGMSFYEQPEIRDLISFLECLQNPLADVPLASLLRSPFVSVTDETLFWLSEKSKATDDRIPLYDGLLKFREIAEISDFEKQKLDAFLGQLQSWRARKDAGRLSDLIEDAVQKTGYAVWALAQVSGIRRYGHVRKFIQLARKQESRGRLSIHRFLALVRRLQFQEVRESDHQAAGEEVKAVRLMTIHAAKGLEFPYVFLADLGRRMNHQERGPVLVLPYAGWAIKVKNPLTGKSEAVWSHEQMGAYQDQQSYQEKKRLFYVAVTRAEEHLVLSGVHKPVKKEREGYADMTSWMEWVMTEQDSFEVVSDVKDAELDLPIAAPTCAAEMPLFQHWLEERKKGVQATAGIEKISAPAQAVLTRVEAMHSPEFSKVIDLPVSAYVLFLKDPEKFWNTYGQGWSLPQEEMRDAISQQEPLARSEDAADFGTRMHRALEYLDWAQPEKTLDAKSMDALFAGFSDEKRKEAGKILSGFFETKIFHEMRTSSKVCRELSFVLNARRGLIDGVIDVLFLNADGSYTVLDYKTAEGDAVKTAERGYDLQIKIYALAASKILKQPVTQAQIYYLKNHQTVSVELGSFDKIESDVNELQLRLLDFVKSKWLCGQA